MCHWPYGQNVLPTDNVMYMVAVIGMVQLGVVFEVCVRIGLVGDDRVGMVGR